MRWDRPPSAIALGQGGALRERVAPCYLTIRAFLAERAPSAPLALRSLAAALMVRRAMTRDALMIVADAMDEAACELAAAADFKSANGATALVRALRAEAERRPLAGIPS